MIDLMGQFLSKSRIFLLTFILTFLFFFCFSPLTYGQREGIYLEERRITNDSFSQQDPDIYKDLIVWTDNRHDYADIYLYDLLTGEERRITDASSYQQNPSLWEDKIVYEDFRHGNWEIYLYDLTTGQEQRITKDSDSQRYPKIWGEKIVWLALEDYGWEVYFFDLLSGQTRRLTSDFYDQADLGIDDNKIVWAEFREKFAGQEWIGDWEIYLYDLTSGQSAAVVVDPDNQSWPVIHQDLIVWEDDRHGDVDIYLYDLATARESRITTSSANQYFPDIAEDKIVWEDLRDGGGVPPYNRDIWLYDILTSEEWQITNDSLRQVAPAIDENKIVYVDEDVHLVKFYFVPQITSVSPTAVVAGETIVIEGINFGYGKDDSRVEFGGGRAGEAQTWSNTSIVCRVPEGTGTGLVRVITPGGESNGVELLVLPGDCDKEGDLDGSGLPPEITDMEILIDMILKVPEAFGYPGEWWCRGDLYPLPLGDNLWNLFDLQRIICLITGEC